MSRYGSLVKDYLDNERRGIANLPELPSTLWKEMKDTQVIRFREPDQPISKLCIWQESTIQKRKTEDVEDAAVEVAEAEEDEVEKVEDRSHSLLRSKSVKREQLRNQSNRRKSYVGHAERKGTDLAVALENLLRNKYTSQTPLKKPKYISLQLGVSTPQTKNLFLRRTTTQTLSQQF